MNASWNFSIRFPKKTNTHVIKAIKANAEGSLDENSVTCPCG